MLTRCVPLNPLAVSSIDIAMWDGYAKSIKKPLCDILGRKRDSIASYASTPLFHSIDEYVDFVKSLEAQHFHTLKFHTWCDIEFDLRMVSEVCPQFPNPVPEKGSVLPDFDTVPPEVVAVRAVPVEKVGVIVDTTSHVSVGIIESLSIRHRFRGVPEVPFPDMPGRIPVRLEEFGQNELRGRQSRVALLRRDIGRDPCPRGDLTGQQTRSRSGTNRRRRKHLGETDAGFGQRIDVRRLNICRTVAIRIHGTLIVCVDDNHVGLCEKRACRKQNETCEEKEPDHSP